LIQIPRLLLRQFWMALRRSRPPQTSRELLPWVVVEAEKDKLTLRAQHSDAVIGVQVKGEYAPSTEANSSCSRHNGTGWSSTSTYLRAWRSASRLRLMKVLCPRLREPMNRQPL